MGFRPAPEPCGAREQTEVPVAEVGTAVGHSALALEDTIGIEEAIGIDEIIRSGFAMDLGQHRPLEVVVVEAVEQLEPDPTRPASIVAERIRPGTRRSHSRTMARWLARSDPARVGEKSFSSGIDDRPGTADW